jgi:uncharacterized protein
MNAASMAAEQQEITQTKNWVREVVIGLNFCPFAAREFNRNSIRYQVAHEATLTSLREVILRECKLLDKDPSIATTLLILPDSFGAFEDYLQLLAYAEKLLQQKKYDGIYQIASFHPLYRFDEVSADDPANYTNRSIYPMLHFIREADLRRAIRFHGHAEDIPARNITFAREKGMEYLKLLRDSCM